MNMKVLVSLALALLLSNFSIAYAKDNKDQRLTTLTVNVLSEAALTGMQLSLKKAVQEGKAKSAVSDCVSAIKPYSFNSVYDHIVSDQFTSEEIAQTEAFFKGDTGKKYSKHGLLQIYSSTGFPLPEPLPTFSPEEMRDLQAFSKTAAGDKLLLKHVMQTPAVNMKVQEKIKELLSSCEK